MDTIQKIEDFQKLTVKYLREILKVENQPCGGKKADLVLRCQAIYQRKVVCVEPDNVSKQEQPLISLISNTKSDHEITYEVLSRDQASRGCEWSKDLRNIPSFNLVQLYDYGIWMALLLKNINTKV